MSLNMTKNEAMDNVSTVLVDSKGRNITRPALSEDADIINNLYPAIVQCFTIILLGYIAGRASIISKNQSKGLGSYVSTFALPALLFKSMMEINFDKVNWMFLASIFISKAIVFAIVVIISLLVVRDFGKTGIYAIFTTQSNDFAIGYLIVQALFNKTHPEYVTYIYLIGPISLCILNPIGFMMMEFQNWKTSAPNERGNNLSAVGKVLKGVILNPIVFMTIIGIMGNFLFKRNVPIVITDILKILGDSFSATALFYLGISLVGKVTGQLGRGLITPALLIIAKTLLLPFIIREVVVAMDAGGERNATLAFGMYGFLYGTFPTAPTVFVYSTQYAIAVDTMATGVVVCTFLSAPLMFVSAKMIMLPVVQKDDYGQLINETCFDISIVGILCSLWVIGVICFSGRWRRVPYSFTLCLVIAQTFSCLGMILWHFLNLSSSWQHYVQFIIFLIGVLGTRSWMAMLAIALCVLRCRSLCYLFRIKSWLLLIGWGAPVMSTGLVIMLSTWEGTQDPSFQYGKAQLIVSVAFLSICLLTTIVCLVYQMRNERKLTQHDHIQREDVQNEEEQSLLKGQRGANNGPGQNGLKSPCANQSCSGDAAAIEEIVPFRKCLISADSQDSDSNEQSNILDKTCSINAGCSTEQRRECGRAIQSYESVPVNLEGDELVLEEMEEYQLMRHVVFLLVLMFSTSLGLFLCSMRLFTFGSSNALASGVYVELEFIDGVFNFGQGFFAFAIFGLDTRLVINPFIRRWRRIMYGEDHVEPNDARTLSEETRHICEQFKTYHIIKCKEAIVSDRRYRLRVYRYVFTGSSLVDWLIRVGLCDERTDAVQYGRKLLDGGVIHHFKDEHHFYDLPYFYRFKDNESEGHHDASDEDMQDITRIVGVDVETESSRVSSSMGGYTTCSSTELASRDHCKPSSSC
ncbi:unnamed protein product [Owenia fusiformis]|uniref:Uncharacterized protein n=1 Tax=Owenia fusiformis TaxID=6347 RepID=A0A8J1UYF8_OWEFU|nr:unnamed protein product [Owenia fusiformis]